MKTVLYTLLFVFTPFFIQSQEKVGEAQYRAVYEFSYKTEPDQTEFAITDLMYLDIGNKISQFYSRHEQVRDSVKHDLLDKGFSAMEVNEVRKGYKKGTTPVYLMRQDEQQTRVITEYLYSGFMYDERMHVIGWSIDEDENIDISGYNCHKATAACFGRDWIVYFTPEIPFNNGPFKLWGLPGLIVRAFDVDRYFLYEMKGFQHLPSVVPIISIESRYSGKKYNNISREQYIAYEKAFHKNAIEFAELASGGSRIKTSDGIPVSTLVKAVPYIPLEPK